MFKKKEKQSDGNDLKRNVEMTEHKEDLDALLERLGTNKQTGLTKTAVKHMLETDGLNRLTPPPETPAWVKFLQELTGFFSLLLWAGAILCFVAYGIQESDDNLYLGIVLAVVVTVTGVFSYFQNAKSESLMKSFKNLLPPKVKAIREGQIGEVESEGVVKGDILQLVGGDMVPADVRMITCSDNLVVDNAALTGESEPQKRRVECTHDEPLETQNLAFFGTTVPEGECLAVVVATGDDTVMGRIAGLAMTTKAKKTPIAIEIEHFIHIISAIAIILGVAFFGGSFAVISDVVTNLVFMIGIIVANVPEGLLATVTVSLTLTALRMSKKMVLVKNLEGVETLGSTSCICSDKTGTLTQNIMTVAQIVYGDGSEGFKIQDCESSFTRGNKTYDETSTAFQRLTRCATLCNVSNFNSESMSTKDGRPIPFMKRVVQGDGSTIMQAAWTTIGNASEGAMIKFCQPIRDIADYRSKNESLFTIPFNSKNKYQVHVHCQEESNNRDGSNDGPRVVLMKGAPERIIARCDKVLVEDQVLPMTDEYRSQIEHSQEDLSRNGLRVLGFAELELDLNEYGPDYQYNDGKGEGYATPNFPLGELDRTEYDGKEVHPASREGLVFIGLMALIDPPRDAVPSAVAKCKTAGIKVIMVTGDHPITAQAIAYKVGILWSKTRGDMIAENERYGRHPGDSYYEDPENAEAIVVPGWDIDVDREWDWWESVLEHPQIVFARTSPQQKLIIVENCQQQGHIVAVTGDGVNDSPALKTADIGVAMGIMGSEVSKQAADMILLDDNFASIVAGVEEGRLIFDNLKKSICYTLTSNIPEISPFLCFITIQTPLPLSTVLILAIDLGTDMVPAISMAYEGAEADIMKRPPRQAKVDRLVTKKLIVLAYLQIGVMQAAGGFFTWMVVLNDYGFPPHILPGLASEQQYGRQPMFCRFNGGQWVDYEGNIWDPNDCSPSNCPPKYEEGYSLWDRGDSGYIIDCEFAPKNLRGGRGQRGDHEFGEGNTYLSTKTHGFRAITLESIQIMEASDYYEYIPWKSRMSPFWKTNWLAWDITKSETLGGAFDAQYALSAAWQPAGIWTICGADPNGTWVSSNVLKGSPEQLQAYEDSIESHSLAGLFDTSARDNDTTTMCDLNSFDITSDKVYGRAIFCNGRDQPNDITPTFSYKVLDDSMEDNGRTIIDGRVVSSNTTTCPDWIQEHRMQLKYCYERCSPDCVEVPLNMRSQDDPNQHQCQNIASRMSQAEALSHAQAAFFVTIVIVQWADLLICKTRWLSIRQQGMTNAFMNFGLFFETLLAAWLSYCPDVNFGLGTRQLRFTHWMPGLPWSMMIFIYDETRKYLMRSTSPEVTDKSTGQVRRLKGWLEENTYY